MNRSALILVGLSLFIAACPPGAKSPTPATPRENSVAERAKGPLAWHVSKSGLGFRLSNADEAADEPVTKKLAKTTPLSADDAKRIAARMPPLKADPDDAKDFAMREKSIPAPRPGTTVHEEFPPRPGPPVVAPVASGPLTIERHAPEGPVELAPHLTMSFSQPMVAITAVDEIAKEKLPVRLTPEPPGKWRWLGARTILFQPEGRFPMATEYVVDVPAGTRSLSGGALAKAEHWTFSTPPVTLKRSWPGGSSEARDPILFAEVDQAIEPAAFLRSIELASARGGAVAIKLAGEGEIEADDAVRRLAASAEKGRWVAFRPERELPTATPFTVRIKAGAPSAEGPRRTPKDQTFGFSTFGPLRMVQASCSVGREKCVPLQPISIAFSNPIDLKRFDKSFVTVTPPIPAMKIEVSGESMTIHGRTKGRTRYDVRIAAALADVHGQTMADEAKALIDVGSSEPTMFGAESDMVVLDPSLPGPKALTIYTINEPGLRTRVYRVTPDDWERYTSFAREWERPRKTPPPGKLVVDAVVKPKGAPDELVATQVDLSAALAGGLGQAVVVVEPTRPMKNGYTRPELNTWVQSTQLGIDAIVEHDRVTTWITKLGDGAPLGDVDVQLTGGASAKSDKNGLASLALTARPGGILVAKRGDDTVILPDHLWGSSGFTRASRSDEVRWLVLDDRGMYKPGEEVRVKGFVRRAQTARGGDLDLVPGASGATVAYSVRDPRWSEIGQGTATVDDQGGFDFSFKLPANANLGRANIQLELPVATGNARSVHTFQIQEFRRPEFEVTASASEGPHYVGESAVATLSAKYYAGGGLPDAPVEWSVTRTTVAFTPPNRSDFHFGPEPSLFWSWHPSIDPKREPKTETWTSHTSPQGLHRLRIDFDALDPPFPMSLELAGQVEDVNRQTWAGRTSFIVHPADDYVGLRLAKNFIHAGESIDVDLVVTDVDGKSVPDRDIVVSAARIDWEQKGTEYEEKEVDLQTCKTASPRAARTETVRCSLKTTQGGSWRVRAIVSDAHGRKNETATQIWVMGGDAPKSRGIDAARATVVPDKKEYKPGDVAELLVLSPFAPAEGLLTVRRQGVVQIERFTMRAASQVIHVKLDDAHVPNVEIAVLLVGADTRRNAAGDPDTTLPKRPAFAEGSLVARVLPVTRTLAVTASAKTPTLEPGGATQIDVDVKAPDGRGVASAEVAVIVADEAVLALSGYKTPDPIAVFYSPRSADVRDLAMRSRVVLGDPDLSRPTVVLHESRMMILQQRDGDVAHGHSAGAMAKPSAAPPMASARSAEVVVVPQESEAPIAMRADFSALALFAPRVRTDASGHATVPVKLPDNLTRYRVMAIAAAGDKMFGADESTITARLPLMVRPSAPRFLSFGDRFELPVIVQNQTDAPLDVGILVRATNAALDAPSAKRVTIPPNDRAEVRFNAAAVSAGTARFQIGVTSGAYSDASEIALPVYTPATTEAFATYGVIDQGATAQQVKMPPAVFPQFGGLEISTSSTELQALTDAVLYLVKYPFECNEQLASRVITIAALHDVLAAFKAQGMPSPEALVQSMKSDFEKLKRLQNANGGWGFWQEEPWPYLSVHVAHALVRAKEKGFQPDEQMLKRAQSYLASIESHYPSWYSAECKRVIPAYALYVRKKMNDADPARARSLIQQAGGVDKLPIEAIGWIWPTISADKGSQAQNEAIRRHVANRVTETAGSAHFVSGYKDGDWVLLNSDRRADGVLLEAMIGDQPQSTLIPKLVKGLLDHRKAGRWTNTQENAFVLLALDRYFNTFEKTTPDFVARVWLGDRFAGEHAFKGRTTERDHIAIPMSFLATVMKGPEDVVVAKDGPGRLYYRLGMQYAPTDLKLPPVDHGFVVSRIYEGADRPEDVRRDADGTWRVKAGAKVRVRVSMVAQARRYHVALVDPLPAGLEPMNPALAVTGEIPKDPKEAASHDRGWFWSRTWYEHQNMRDERVEAFASLVWDGVWDYTYVAKATTPGTYVVAPPKAEEMYAPETFGRGAGDRMIVE